MSRLVAEIRRKLTLTGFLEPTGSISPSCSARSSLTWASSGSSPISSRKSVPVSASWNLPMRLSTAPVNEPFSWPNSMLSTRFSGMAPQLTVTKGLERRSLSPWMARAISSLPTPLSPSISTGMLEAAARRPSAITRCMAWPRMMRSEKVSVPSAFFLMRDDLALQGFDLQRALDGDFEPLDRGRLDHEVDGTGAHGGDRRVDRAVGGLHDDGRREGFWRGALEDLHAADAGITRSSSTSAMAAPSGPSRICRACSPPWAVLVS